MNESTSTVAGGLRTLYRHPTQRALAGVAGGIAEWLGWDVTFVRILWVVLFFATAGTALPVYIVLALFLPVGTQGEGELRRATIHVGLHANKALACVLISVGTLWLLSNLGILPGLSEAFFAFVRVAFWPLVLIFVGWRILVALGVRLGKGDLSAQMQGWGRSAAAWGAETGDRMRAGASRAQENAQNESAAVGLTRSSSDRIFAGVCGGIARRFQIDPALVRLLWAMVSLATLGLGVIAYLVAALLLPVDVPQSATQGTTSQGATSQGVQNVEAQEIAIQREGTVDL